MLKITRNEVNRKITLDEFIRMKNKAPFKGFRQSAKSENFLLIFGGGAKVLFDQLEPVWTKEETDEFFEANNIKPIYDQLKGGYYGKMYAREPHKLKLYACCVYIRENFFKGYPALLSRTKREADFGTKYGFVRSQFGATRKVIQLMLAGEWDKKHLSANIKNWQNICANTAIQNLEAAVTKRAMWEFQEWALEHNLKSWMWNEIHDSIDIYVHCSELVPVLWKIKKLCERHLPEFDPSPVVLKIDCEVSDLNKGQYYKGGIDPDMYFPEGVEWSMLDSMTEEEALSWIEKSPKSLV